MNEYRQSIIFATYDGHVVLEFGGINLAASACQHIDDVVLQSLKIHIDVVSHCINGTCGSPIAAAATTAYCLHHTVGVEHRLFIANLVTVIPLHQFVEVHLVLLGKGFDFVLGKSEELCHIHRLHHRILDEVV